MVTEAQLRRFVEKLCQEELYDPDEGYWCFESGGSCCVCTDAAVKIVEAFGGRVVGYYSSENPSAFIGGELCEGQDFAIIADWFVVDYWSFRVKQIIKRPIFDLRLAQDRREVRRLYGDPNRWEEVLVSKL
jgi:hypothetical protein